MGRRYDPCSGGSGGLGERRGSDEFMGGKENGRGKGEEGRAKGRRGGGRRGKGGERRDREGWVAEIEQAVARETVDVGTIRFLDSGRG